MKKEERDLPRPSTITAEGEGVVLPPGRPHWSVVVAVSFSETTVLLANAGQATGLTPLVDGLSDPADTRISGNSLVIRVDEYDFVVFVNAVLVNPVRVQDSQVSATPSNTLFSGAAQSALELEVVDTLTNGLAVCSTLWHGLLPVTPPDTDTIDNISLLGLVA